MKCTDWSGWWGLGYGRVWSIGGKGWESCKMDALVGFDEWGESVGRVVCGMLVGLKRLGAFLPHKIPTFIVFPIYFGPFVTWAHC
jgi:hypothetical protein